MNIFELPVHPDAAAFRMLPPDELQALADDIKTKGLNHPLVTTTIVAFDEKTGDKVETLVLVDGRNRREACKMAGVKPDVVDLNGKDVKGFITSENTRRRHDTKGMQAMSYAIMYPDKSKGGRGNKNSAINADFSATYIKQARVILEHCDADTVESVKVGVVKLTDAYEAAKDIRDGVKEPTDEERLAKISVELADKVREGEMTLVGAEAEHAEIERIAKANRDAALRNMRDGIYGFGTFFMNSDRIMEGVELLTEYRSEFEEISNRKVSDSLPYLRAMEEHIALLITAAEQE